MRADVSAPSEAAVISRGMVTLVKRLTGRGPVRARTTIGRDHALVMLYETLTQADKSLVAAGYHETVQTSRTRIQEVMRADAKRLVEETLHREVIGFMSANHFEPDVAAEVFVLKPPAEEGPASVSEDEVYGQDRAVPLTP